MLIRKKGNFRFVGRKHSRRGIFSAVLGVIACVLVVILAVISGIQEGQGGRELGLAASAGFMVSGIGFYLAAHSLKEKDVFYAAPITGIILNGGMFLFYMILYIIGIG